VAVDVLGEVLTTLELSSQLYFRAELSSPFAIAVPEERGVIRFHVAAEGQFTIGMPDAEPLIIGTGDLVLVPHGAAHVLSDHPDTAAKPLSAVLDASGFDGVGPLLFGGGGERTVVVCGHFGFGDTSLHPLVAGLPPLLHLRAAGGASYEWMEHVVRRIECEARTRQIGYGEVARRLSEILLVEVLRAQAEVDLAALSALADPQLGRALEAIHARPHESWSLEALARIAGHSRTLFAERFRERLGVTPMKYLTTWRMQKARGLLARAENSVAEVARRVGYHSESAFNRAFRAEFGAAPGRYRRARVGLRTLE
jgi:AraC-like DNA-binding protein